jgi:hypothetical protein
VRCSVWSSHPWLLCPLASLGGPVTLSAPPLVTWICLPSQPLCSSVRWVCNRTSLPWALEGCLCEALQTWLSKGLAPRSAQRRVTAVSSPGPASPPPHAERQPQQCRACGAARRPGSSPSPAKPSVEINPDKLLSRNFQSPWQSWEEFGCGSEEQLGQLCGPGRGGTPGYSWREGGTHS